MQRCDRKSTFSQSGSSYGVDGVDGVLYGVYGVYDLSTRDPTDHPEPYIQPWMDNIKTTSFKTKETKEKEKEKEKEKNNQDHAEQKEDNAMHLENDKFKL
jgi:hypothetical protein